MKKWRIIFFILGLAGLAVLIIQSDPTQYNWQEILSRDLFLILLGQLVIWAVIYFIHVVVYKDILGKEYFKEVGWARMTRICLTGFALNNVTPAGLVGGEPYRIMELKPFCGTEKATSSTLTFTVFYTMGHVLLWVTGTVFYFLLGAPGEISTSILLAISGIVLGFACFAFIRSRNHGFIMPLFRFFGKLPLISRLTNKLLEKHGEQYTNIDREISEFSHDRRVFRRVLLLEYLTRLLEAGEYFFIFKMLGENINYPGGLVIMSMASLIGNVFFMIPMQAGTRESGMTIGVNWLGLSDGSGFMGGLLYRVRELLCIAVGISLILIGKTVKNRTEKRNTASSDHDAAEKQQ